MTATTKLCSRSGTFPTKNERELTTVYFSPAKQVNHTATARSAGSGCCC